MEHQQLHSLDGTSFTDHPEAIHTTRLYGQSALPQQVMYAHSVAPDAPVLANAVHHQFNGVGALQPQAAVDPTEAAQTALLQQGAGNTGLPVGCEAILAGSLPRSLNTSQQLGLVAGADIASPFAAGPPTSHAFAASAYLTAASLPGDIAPQLQQRQLQQSQLQQQLNASGISSALATLSQAPISMPLQQQAQQQQQQQAQAFLATHQLQHQQHQQLLALQHTQQQLSGMQALQPAAAALAAPVAAATGAVAPPSLLAAMQVQQAQQYQQAQQAQQAHAEQVAALATGLGALPIASSASAAPAGAGIPGGSVLLGTSPEMSLTTGYALPAATAPVLAAPAAIAPAPTSAPAPVAVPSAAAMSVVNAGMVKALVSSGGRFTGERVSDTFDVGGGNTSFTPRRQYEGGETRLMAIRSVASRSELLDAVERSSSGGSLGGRGGSADSTSGLVSNEHITSSTGAGGDSGCAGAGGAIVRYELPSDVSTLVDVLGDSDTALMFDEWRQAAAEAAEAGVLPSRLPRLKVYVQWGGRGALGAPAAGAMAAGAGAMGAGCGTCGGATCGRVMAPGGNRASDRGGGGGGAVQDVPLDASDGSDEQLHEHPAGRLLASTATAYPGTPALAAGEGGASGGSPYSVAEKHQQQQHGQCRPHSSCSTHLTGSSASAESCEGEEEGEEETESSGGRSPQAAAGVGAGAVGQDAGGGGDGQQEKGGGRRKSRGRSRRRRHGGAKGDVDDGLTPLQRELSALAERLEIISMDEIQLVRFLGSGSFGEVYLGRWRDSEVAVKCLNPSLFGDGQQLSRSAIQDLISEAELLASLRHPNIVFVYGLVLPDMTVMTSSSSDQHDNQQHFEDEAEAADAADAAASDGSQGTLGPNGGSSNAVGGGGQALFSPKSAAAGPGKAREGTIDEDLTAAIVRQANALPGRLRPPALVVEHMGSRSLRGCLNRRADILAAPSSRLLVALDVARGMEYLHSKGLVHFDLKSGNVLLGYRDRRPVAKVGDFGLSKQKHQTFVTGVTSQRGTLPWTAPEILRTPNKVTEKADVFSFGIVLWELWTMREPYEGINYHALMLQLSSDANLRPTLPTSAEWEESDPVAEPAPGWEALTVRCWASDPDDRPTFAEVARCLKDMVVAVKRERAKTQRATSAPSMHPQPVRLPPGSQPLMPEPPTIIVRGRESDERRAEEQQQQRQLYAGAADSRREEAKELQAAQQPSPAAESTVEGQPLPREEAGGEGAAAAVAGAEAAGGAAAAGGPAGEQGPFAGQACLAAGAGSVEEGFVSPFA